MGIMIRGHKVKVRIQCGNVYKAFWHREKALPKWWLVFPAEREVNLRQQIPQMHLGES